MAVYMARPLYLFVNGLYSNLIPRYGAFYLLLQLIPGLSMLFLLTAAASSALWAVDIERKRRAHEAHPDVAPEYSDNPEGSPV